MRFFLLFFVPFLSACVNDGTAYDISGNRQKSISILREQPFFWKKTVSFAVILSRMPECTRRHDMGLGSTASVVDVFEVPSGAYILHLDKRYFAAELETCEGFAQITDLNEKGEPQTGLGVYKGRFLSQKGVWTFNAAASTESEQTT